MNVELILSAVLAVATVFYTVINLMMWLESRATRRQKITPMIVAYLKVTEDHGTLALHLKNIGEGCAKDVSIKVTKDYNQFKKDNYPLSKCQAFRNGVNIFPPGYELKYYLDSMDDIDSSSDNNYVELVISYKDVRSNRYDNNRFLLPFNQIAGNYSDPPETYMAQIPYYLKKLYDVEKSRQ